ncbi:pectinesterase-like [Zingiber officinale]|uniref:pectinesterase-like n=1 Tax=Zingiber officinale TaxID=94328 RepID=UPI001C4B43ED|nr:pectinesterase-like [Zingiber officinale]
MATTPPLLLLLLLSTPAMCLEPQCTTPTKDPGHRGKPSQAGSYFVPSPSFVSSIKSTLEQISKLTSLVSSFSRHVGSGRLSFAVDDCLELLDLSFDELTWTLSVGGKGQPSDLHSWMSAALGNQDTCKESLSDAGAGRFIARLVFSGLDRVTSLVSDGLREIAGAGGKQRRLMGPGIPDWVSAQDKRLLLAGQQQAADVVVAQDGTGNYTTVAAAVEAAPTESGRRYVIYVTKGVYRENVEIKKRKWNLMLIGDGMGQTVISSNRSFVDGWTTYRSATLAVTGKGFICRDLTVENTAGQVKHQAVALRSDSDLSVFYRCEFAGYQDTLYAHSLRQFFRDCYISGTVDFIFGNAAAVFQNSQIISRRPLQEQKNTITAQGRKDPNQNTGFSFHLCNVSAAADLVWAGTNSTATYLGRPWKQYSRAVFMESYIGPVIREEGWLPWAGDFAIETLFYGEYMNTGPGSGLAGRVKWPGFHAMRDKVEAANFTVAEFIDGNLWIPATGVKYTAGLTV